MRYPHLVNTHFDGKISPFIRMSYALQLQVPSDYPEPNSHLPVFVTWIAIWFEPWQHPLCLLLPKDPDPYVGHLEPLFPSLMNNDYPRAHQSSRKKRDPSYSVFSLLWALEPWITLVVELDHGTRKLESFQIISYPPCPP